MGEKISRRSFLKITGAVGGAFLLSSCGFVDRMKGEPQTQLPTLEGAWTLENDVLALDLSKLPELADLGGAVRIEGDALLDPLLVVLGEDGNYYAFKNACTHGGRMIDPVAGKMVLKCCSMSRSTFNYEGEVVSGPAEEPLTSYPLEINGNQLLINL